MYLRGIHAETDLRVLRQLIRDNPLGMITTAIKSKEHPFLQTSHVPFILDIDDETSETELGRLRGHMARQNPQSKAMMEELTSRAAEAGAGTNNSDNVLEQDVLVLFNAQHHHYVTPKFYTETKPATGKVVPTWNYAAAQVYGRAKVYFDSKSDETSSYLTKQVQDLTKHSEVHVMGYTGTNGRQKDWEVADAPDRYVETLKKNIIGIEIDITDMGGKFKMSQEMGEGDRQGIVEGFQSLGTEAGRDVGSTVKLRGELKDQTKPAST